MTAASLLLVLGAAWWMQLGGLSAAMGGFLAVGMALDITVILAINVAALTILQAAGVYGVARAFKASHREAIELTILMTQGGKFACLLCAAALAAGIIDPEGSAMLTAIIMSMAMRPLFLLIHDRLMPEVEVDASGVETPHDTRGTALLIGPGRFSARPPARCCWRAATRSQPSTMIPR